MDDFCCFEFVLLLYQLSDIVRVGKKKPRQITEGRDTEKRLAEKFLAFHAKLKFILLLIFLEMFKTVSKRDGEKVDMHCKFPYFYVRKKNSINGNIYHKSYRQYKQTSTDGFYFAITEK